MRHRKSFKRTTSYWWGIGGFATLIVALVIILAILLSGNLYK